MDKLIISVLSILFGILFIVVIGLLFAFPVMWLWNGVLVGLVAGISPINSVWNACGLFILCGLLFKSSNK